MPAFIFRGDPVATNAVELLSVARELLADTVRSGTVSGTGFQHYKRFVKLVHFCRYQLLHDRKVLWYPANF